MVGSFRRRRSNSEMETAAAYAAAVLVCGRIQAMSDSGNLKRRVVHRVQRLLVNPVGRQLPVTMIETTGRKSGQPRRTAVGGRVVDNQFWMVSEHGEHSDYIRNIKANPAVRVRVGGRWRNGTPTCCPTMMRCSGWASCRE